MEQPKRPFDLAKLDFDKRRHDKRRRWLLRSLPAIILVVLIGLWLMAPLGLTTIAIGQYTSKNYAGANQTVTPISILNFFEKFKVYYNQGTALSMNGDYDQATTKLETALAYAPSDSTCTIVYNLVLNLEHAGDHAIQGKDLTKIVNYYTQALAQLTAKADCFKKTPDIQARIQIKLDAARQKQTDDTNTNQPDDQSNQPTDQQKADLQKNQEDAQGERQEDNQFTEDQNNADYDTSYRHW